MSHPTSEKEAPKKAYWNLTSGQRALALMHQLDPESGVYNICYAWKIKGSFDWPLFKTVMRSLAHRHPSLRSTYEWRDGEPVQVVNDDVVDFFYERDISSFSDADLLSDLRDEQLYSVFNLESEPPLRWTYCFRGNGDPVLLFLFHHIAGDGWSVMVLFNEIRDLYNAAMRGESGLLPDIEHDHNAFLAVEKTRIEGAQSEGLLRFWRKYLGEDPPALNLAPDKKRPSRLTFKGRALKAPIPESISERLKGICLETGISPFVMYMSVFKLFLRRYSGQHDISIGTPTAGRDKRFERVVAYYVNPVAVRTHIAGDPTFMAFFKEVGRCVSDVLAHSAYPFPKVVEEVVRERDPSRPSLVQVAFGFENANRFLNKDNPLLTLGENGNELYDMGCMTWERIHFRVVVDEFELLLKVVKIQESYYFLLDYNTSLFYHETAQRMVSHYLALLQSVAANPHQKLSQMSMLTPEERRQLLADWNQTAQPVETRLFHQLVASHGDQTPQAPAVVFENVTLTYAQLNQRANRLAHQLVDRGVRSDDLVGIFMERSAEVMVAILAVFKAGAAYLPLDPEYPSDRLQFMIEDAEVKVILAHQTVVDQLPPHQAEILFVGPDQASEQELVAAPRIAVQPGNAAYAIYTSGSTGRPKGVVVTHGGLSNLLVTQTQVIHLTSEARVLLFASLNFDASIWAIAMGLQKGSTLYTAGKEDLLGDNLIEFLTTKKISAVLLPPSLLATFSPQAMPDLVNLFVGGEACSRELAMKWVEGRNFINAYGPTESTVWSTTALLDGNQTPPIGKPVANTKVYVVDAHLNPNPVGVPGELLVAGLGLARGYLKRPELTAAAFIPNPFSDVPGDRLYRTGDLVRYLPSGDIEFLGRIDHQVKIRGFRIELGEIEALIRSHELVRDCLVMVRDEPGGKFLVGYVVKEPDAEGDRDQIVSTLRRAMAEQVPDYMIPSAFLVLDAFPMTPNEKIDRRKLAAMQLNRIGMGRDYTAPRTPLEEVLEGIWCEVLSRPKISVTDNFFNLGGHSIKATQALSRIKKALGVNLSLTEFFKAPTIVDLASAINDAQHQTRESCPIQLIDRSMPIPLSFAQRQLWFIDQLTPGNPAYNIPFAFYLKGELNIKALKGALNCIVLRHEALRTTFPMVDEQPVQMIDHDFEIDLKIVDLWGLPEEEWRDEIQREAVEEGMKSFDLAVGPLVRFTLLGLAAQEHVFLLTLHHTVADGWSVGIFLTELMHAYESLSQDKPLLLKPPSIQYADYSVWQHQQLKGDDLKLLLEYWRKELSGNSFVFELPSDRPRPREQSHAGATVHVGLPADLVEKVKDLSRERGCTLFMTLFSAFQVLLHRYTGQTDILCGTAVANRGRAELEGLIGFFVNTLVLRTDLSGSPSFEALSDRVRKSTLDAYAHQDLPFAMLVDELHPERDLSRNPIFQIMFVLQNAPMPDFKLGGLSLEPLEMERGVSHFDLEVSLVETANGITGSFEYCTALFDRAMITRMVGHYRKLLEAVVADPQTRISHLSFLMEEERRQLLLDRNDTMVDYPRHRAVHHLIEETVRRWPDDVAVTFEDKSLTYGELDHHASRLATYLQQRGVGPDVMVGVCTERSLDMLVALLGVFKAGAGYLPLDPGFPRERLVYMLEDAKAPFLLTQANLVSYLGEHTAETICLDSDWKDIAKQKPLSPSIVPDAANLAYMIYTSGSTGRPKGVQLTHGNLMNLILSMKKAPGFTKRDRIVAVTTLSFDISKVEMFLPLIVGGEIVIASRDVAMNGERLLALIKSSKATHCQATPVTWRLLVSAGWGLTPRIHIWSGGEPIAPELGEALVARGTLWNMYGPSETTIYSVIFHVRSAKETIAIGKAVNNTTLYILDGNLQPVPEGVPGELYIGGEGLGRGYFDRQGLTAEKFVPNPFGTLPGDRIYASGDLVRYMADGNIECLGRIDHQVKVRGYRIELGEIEAVLVEHPSVKQAVVIVREDTPGDKRLVAYLTADDPKPEVGELIELGRKTLPAYMIPSAFVVMDAFPQTPSGKIDRKSLPEPSDGLMEDEKDVKLPTNAVEEKIARIWCEVLKRKRVGIDTNFFESGGNSLLLTQVAAKLQKVLGKPVPVITLFQYTTIRTLAQHLGGKAERVQEGDERDRVDVGGPVAVIGLSGRFPRAASVQEFWSNLSKGVECISTFSKKELLDAGIDKDTLENPHYIGARGVLDHISCFDNRFFGYSPNEAKWMDPQQRIFLECAWSALETAGYGPGTVTGRVGVFGATRFSSYFLQNILTNPDMVQSAGELPLMVGNDKDFLTTRVSYKLNLKGPSTLVQTGCSSSLVAVHQACRALAAGDCETALAGGVSVTIPQKVGYTYTEGSIFSKDGHCRPFDAKASGTIGGSGVGIVVLKSLRHAVRDGDTIHAVIYGSAVNNDGSDKIGYTAPSVSGQQNVILEAHRSAAIAMAQEQQLLVDEDLTTPPAWSETHAYAHTVSYIEAHGTGTILGDPTEVKALTDAFALNLGAPKDLNGFAPFQPKTGYCALGSVKGNIGHLDPAAGIAGFIKVVMALKHQVLPASLHFEKPNPAIPFQSTPFVVNAETRHWDTDGIPRVAGVSSFGIGGTNVHVVLKEAPDPSYLEALRKSMSYSTPAQAVDVSVRKRRLLVFSAKTSQALEQMTEDMLAHLSEVHGLAGAGTPSPDFERALADTAYTLQLGRAAWDHRRVVVCGVDNALQVLKTQSPKSVFSNRGSVKARPVVFMFSGQGSQYPGMGRDLYQAEPLFRNIMDTFAEFLAPLIGHDLRELLLYGEASPDEAAQKAAAELLMRTEFSQPALFAIEYALASLWMSRGVAPYAMIGHSIGEYTAAALAGVFSWEDALRLVVCRGQVMQAQPEGDMLAIPFAEDKVLELLSDHPGVSLATINGPKRCVVAGPAADITALADHMAEKGLKSVLLHTSHAFHSAMMEPAKDALIEAVQKITLAKPGRPTSAFVETGDHPFAPAVFVSNLTGGWVTPENTLSPHYWGNHLRSAVRFSAGIQCLLDEEGDLTFLEVGPGRTLETFAKDLVGQGADAKIYGSLRHPKSQVDDLEYFYTALGRLWLDGQPIDWNSLYEGRASEGEDWSWIERRTRVPLPTYPFKKESHWVSPGKLTYGAKDAAGPVVDPDLESGIQERTAPDGPAGTGGNAASAPSKQWALDQFEKRDPSQWLYTSTWVPRRPTVEAPPDQPVVGRWLIFADDFGVGADLGRWLAGKIGETNVNVKALPKGDGQETDWTREVQDFKGTGESVGVVYGWSMHSPDADPDLVLKRNFFDLIGLTQALCRLDLDTPIRLYLLTNQAYAVEGAGNPLAENKLVAAFAKVAPEEFDQIRCRVLDLDLDGSAQQTQTAQAMVQQEIRLGEAEMNPRDQASQPAQSEAYSEQDAVLVLRDGKRYTRQFTRPTLKDTSPDLSGKTFLITGGLGGIGLDLAEALCACGVAKIALMSRSSFFPRDQWAQRLAAEDVSSKDRVRLQKLLNLDKQVELLLVKGDVTRADSVQGAVSRVQEVLGAVHGVVHSAGVPGGAPLTHLTRKQAEDVLAPRRAGVRHLTAALDPATLEHFIMCSSLNALSGGPGQLDYCAANMYLDAFAEEMRHQIKGVISINWDTWSEVGMAVHANLSAAHRAKHEAVLAKGMQSEEAKAVFKHILQLTGPCQVAVSTFDLGSKIEVMNQLLKPDLEVAIDDGANLSGIVAKFMGDMLGYEQLEEDADFLDLGGDSLLSISLAAALKKYFEVEITSDDIMRLGSVSAIAERIAELGGGAKQAQPRSEASPKQKPEADPRPAGERRQARDDASKASGESPLDQIQATVIAICKRALGMDSLSPEDGIRDLGGTTEVAKKIAAEVKETYGITLSFETVSSNMTPDFIALKIYTVQRLAESLKRRGTYKPDGGAGEPNQPNSAAHQKPAADQSTGQVERRYREIKL